VGHPRAFPLAISAITSAAENELLLLMVTPLRVVPQDCAWTYMTDSDIRGALTQSERTRMTESPHGAVEIDLLPALRRAQRLRRAESGVEPPQSKGCRLLGCT
jgi:hypothetical protein